jgi:hypothetical protein
VILHPLSGNPLSLSDKRTIGFSRRLVIPGVDIKAKSGVQYGYKKIVGI